MQRTKEICNSVLVRLLHLWYIHLCMTWTSFDAKLMPRAAKVMHVTLSPRSEFYLNQGAMIKLGEPVAVKLLYNKPAGLMGIAAVPLNAKASIELRPKYGAEASGRVFRATEFCKSLGLQFDRTIMFRDPKIEDGILVLDINTTVYAPKRAVSMERLMREAGYAPPDRLDLE